MRLTAVVAYSVVMIMITVTLQVSGAVKFLHCVPKEPLSASVGKVSN